jgi:HPt (histidine-containing phosphotransfer) domain-containing protein
VTQDRSADERRQAARESSLGQDGFPAIPCLNIQRAISFLGDDPALFRSFLSNFVEEFAGTKSALREHLAATDREAAAKLLHALRGAAAYIGADELVACAKTLETAISENKTIPDSLTNDFERAFEALMTAVREA